MTVGERQGRGARRGATVAALATALAGIAVAIDAIWPACVPRSLPGAALFFGCIAFLVVHNGSIAARRSRRRASTRRAQGIGPR
jgi:hypothetical protein